MIKRLEQKKVIVYNTSKAEEDRRLQKMLQEIFKPR